MARIFKPLNKARGKENANFWTLDIETKDGLKGKELLIGAIYRPNDKVKEENRIHYFVTIEELLDNLLIPSIPSQNTMRKKGKYKNIFIHNLTFDIRFVLQEAIGRGDFKINLISSGSKDLVVELIHWESGYKFRFIDSYQFVLCSQEKFEKAILGEKIKRTDIKVGEDQSLTFKDYKERVKWDVIGLYKAIKEYFKMIHELFDVKVNSGKLISLSSLAMKIFRTGFMREPIYNPFIKQHLEGGHFVVENREVLEKIFLAYFGGRTELFKKKICRNINCFDINSLYPSQFSKHYPTKYIGEFTVRSMKELNSYLSERLGYEGFLDTDRGLVEELYSQIPILPTKESNKTIFRTGEKRGVFTFPEIRYALKLKRIRIHFPCKVIIFRSSKFFGDFGEFCYYERLKFKKEGSPFQLPIKIIMNSLSGKFGQKLKQTGMKVLTVKEIKEYYGGEKTLEQIIDPRKKLRIKEVREELNGQMVVYYESESINLFTLPHISSYVTAYARIELHKALDNNKKNLIYCDTDSIFVEGEAKNIIESDRLGDWKLEYHAEKGAFIGLKFYAVKIDEKLKIKIKGVSKQMIEKAQFQSIEDFWNRATKIEFEEEERYNTIKSSIRRFNTFLSSSKRIKNLSGKYDKRIVLPNGETQPLNRRLNSTKNGGVVNEKAKIKRTFNQRTGKGVDSLSEPRTNKRTDKRKISDSRGNISRFDLQKDHEIKT